MPVLLEIITHDGKCSAATRDGETVVWELDRPCGVSYWYDVDDVKGIATYKKPGERFVWRKVTLADVPAGVVVSQLGFPDERVQA